MTIANTTPKDDLDKALDDSFPASDPPSMTTGTTATPTEPHTAASTDPQAAYLQVFRVVKAPEADAPFGEQPHYGSGRWSSEGTPVVYASTTEACAILEHLAHARPGEDNELFLATATLPSDCVITQASLPSTWTHYPYHASSQCIGDQWSREHKSLALRVPSALAPNSCNVLINPLHVDKVHLQSVTTEPVRIDPRLRG